MTYKSQMGGFGQGRGMMPPVIKMLIIINVAIFVIQNMLLSAISVPFTYNGVSGRILLSELIVHYLGLQPIGDFNSIELLLTPLQLVSYQFLHGGFTHILFNMFSLWMFGIELENTWGPKKFLIFYLLSGIGGGIFQLIIQPLIGPAAVTIGASGAIFGVLLAYGLTFPNRSVFMFPIFIPIPAKTFVLIIGGLQILLGFMSSDNVAHFAHLGGAVTGWLLLKYGNELGVFSLFGKVDQGKASYQEPIYKSKQSYSSQPKIFQFDQEISPNKDNIVSNKTTVSKSYDVDGVTITQDIIDNILDKINESGYQNLTEKEKHILNELSKKI